MLLFSSGNKVIVDITTGEKIGYLKSCDLKVDEKTGLIEAIMLPRNKFNLLFSSETDHMQINWNKVKKIGTDTILVEL